jgi:protein SCO1
VVALGLLLAVGWLASSCLGQTAGRGSRLVGTDLGAEPAPDFTLLDQQGRELALSDLRGKAVALTFLYSSCPDVCPVITNKFGTVHDELGEQAQAVAFVAVTVDPERDTATRLRQYLEAQGLAGKMLFLTGDRAKLEAAWSAYHILVSRSSPEQATYTVTHSDVVYILDKAGRMRVLLHTDLLPADLQRNLELLIAE